MLIIQSNKNKLFFLNVFFCRFAPFSYLYFSYFSINEPELGAGIDPAVAFNPFPSSILNKTRQESNPQPLDCEMSPLTIRPDLRPTKINCFNGEVKKKFDKLKFHLHAH